MKKCTLDNRYDCRPLMKCCELCINNPENKVAERITQLKTVTAERDEAREYADHIGHFIAVMIDSECDTHGAWQDALAASCTEQARKDDWRFSGAWLAKCIKAMQIPQNTLMPPMNVISSEKTVVITNLDNRFEVGPGEIIELQPDEYPVEESAPQGKIRPRVVCLCGSTRFSEEFRQANLRETLEGKIVLSVGCNFKSDDALGVTCADKDRLDELHLRKIDMADEVLILNVCGYIGSSTWRELEYAVDHGKIVRFLEPCSSAEWNRVTIGSIARALGIPYAEAIKSYPNPMAYRIDPEKEKKAHDIGVQMGVIPHE